MHRAIGCSAFLAGGNHARERLAAVRITAALDQETDVGRQHHDRAENQKNGANQKEEAELPTWLDAGRAVPAGQIRRAASDALQKTARHPQARVTEADDDQAPDSRPAPTNRTKPRLGPPQARERFSTATSRRQSTQGNSDSTGRKEVLSACAT